jgi:hypothetical protein
MGLLIDITEPGTKTMNDSMRKVRHTVSIGRTHGLLGKSKNSLGTDAIHAVMSISGAFDVEIQSESPEVAVVSYIWQMPEPFTRYERTVISS